MFQNVKVYINVDQLPHVCYALDMRREGSTPARETVEDPWCVKLMVRYHRYEEIWLRYLARGTGWAFVCEVDETL